MLYSEIKERENRFILSLKIATPFIFIIIFTILIVVTDVDIKSLLKNNIIAFLVIIFLYIYYILYQINRAFKTSLINNITKTFSRDYMLKIIEKEIKRDKFLLVMLKISNIEDINNRYGINKTDTILSQFIYELDFFLSSNGFKNNKIGHIVGGSFVFIIKTDEKKIDHLIRQFINKIEREQIDNIFLKVIYSIIRSNSENSVQELLVSLFEKVGINSIDRKENKKLNIKVSEFEKLIVNLIENRKFDFRFQPIQNVKSKEIEIYEILVRLNSKEYGKISQHQFISVVNRIGYEVTFDLILIEEIFKLLSKVDNNKKISINISLYSIRSSYFLNRVKKLILKYSMRDNIILEISVNNNLNDIIRLSENINILKSLGFIIAIDNFGADNTSFGYIKNINFDIVKFDIEFSKKYDKVKYFNILKAFVSIFNDLKIKTVIKFIENEKSYNFFKDLNVDYIQGFIIGKPSKEIK